MKTIVFEGGEGSGKGTVIASLEAYLRDTGKTVIRTREPGGTNISERIRNVIVSDESVGITPETEALLFAASRAQLMSEFIFPTLEKYLHDDNAYLLIDRFVYSNMVYQGIVRGLGVDKVIAMNSFGMKGWMPDMVIYLDIEPERGLARISANPNREVNRLDKETLEFHHKVRDGYLSLAQRYDNFVVINADQSPDKVLEDVINQI